jgi:hypothetical protein
MQYYPDANGTSRTTTGDWNARIHDDSRKWSIRSWCANRNTNTLSRLFNGFNANIDRHTHCAGYLVHPPGIER